MTHPDDDTLAAIALGDPAPSGAAEHARSCPQCSHALTALRDTVTTLRAPAPELVAPPASVWDAVEAELDREPQAAATAPASVATATAPSPGAAQAAAPAPAPTPDAGDELTRRRSSRAARRPFPLAWVAGAAAAGLVIGVVGARALQTQQDPVTTIASTTLDTIDKRQVRGSADVVKHDGRLDLQVTTTPMDAGNGYLEVWLINKDLKRMVSLGVLEPGTKNQPFVIPQNLLDQGYVIVDISREGLDGSPQHSGESLMRGTLAT